MKKNFASIDCGAKIVAASEESQGSENILTPTRDEYMLNKCKHGRNNLEETRIKNNIYEFY